MFSPSQTYWKLLSQLTCTGTGPMGLLDCCWYGWFWCVMEVPATNNLQVDDDEAGFLMFLKKVQLFLWTCSKIFQEIVASTQCFQLRPLHPEKKLTWREWRTPFRVRNLAGFTGCEDCLNFEHPKFCCFPIVQDECSLALGGWFTTNLHNTVFFEDFEVG